MCRAVDVREPDGQKGWRGHEAGRPLPFRLVGGIRKGRSGEAASGQRLTGAQEVPPSGVWGRKCPGQWAGRGAAACAKALGQGQGPAWPVLPEEQPGDTCGQSRVGKEEREEGREGAGQVSQGPVGQGKTWASTPGRWGPDSGAHGRPLVAAVGRADQGEGRS